jgi:hypothetical protein
MTSTPSASSSTPWWWLLIAIMAISSGMIWFACVLQYIHLRDALGQCISSAPPGIIVSEDSSHYSFNMTFFPIGRECIYDVVGGGTVTTSSGWFTTIVALLGSAAVMSSFICCVPYVKMLSVAQRVCATLFFAAAGVGWCVIAQIAGTW